MFLYQQLGTAKYKSAADKIRQKFDTFPKNAEGGFWHKDIYPNEMWLDGIFMAEPFLVQYGLIASCGAFCNDTATFQANLIATHVLNHTTGLARHGWDQDKNAAWANATTGLSPEVWGRGTGWYAVALVDLLRLLPSSHPRYAQLLTNFRDVARGIRDKQDATTGLWFQVLDKGTMSGNWRESSASGLFVYALKEGVRRGILDATYDTAAQKGWTGLKTKVTNDANGPIINDAVEGMGVQTSYANYINKQHLSNSWHGLCAVMLAGVEMEF
jgi:unsaturated rhamnogalacturonyl hydrolase